jgi:hypothetical protein
VHYVEAGSLYYSPSLYRGLLKEDEIDPLSDEEVLRLMADGIFCAGENMFLGTKSQECTKPDAVDARMRKGRPVVSRSRRAFLIRTDEYCTYTVAYSVEYK